ncbi:MAG: hypothetical protein ABIF77_03215 [bacterium]
MRIPDNGQNDETALLQSENSGCLLAGIEVRTWGQIKELFR